MTPFSRGGSAGATPPSSLVSVKSTVAEEQHPPLFSSASAGLKTVADLCPMVRGGVENWPMLVQQFSRVDTGGFVESFDNVRVCPFYLADLFTIVCIRGEGELC